LVSGINIDSSSKLTKIADNAFRNLTSLVGTITLPSKVDYVGESAFENTNITNLVFNSTLLRTISKNSFKNCKQLRVDLTIPASIYYIEEGAFNGSGIKSIVYNSALRGIRKEAFANCSSLVTMNEMPNTLNAIGDLVFANDTNLSLSSYNIKDSIKDFGNSIFSGVSKTNISVPAFWDDQPEGWIKGYAGQYQVRRGSTEIVLRTTYDKTRTMTDVRNLLTDNIGVQGLINKSVLNEYIDISSFPEVAQFKLEWIEETSTKINITVRYDKYFDSQGRTKNDDFKTDIRITLDKEEWNVFNFNTMTKLITGLAADHTNKSGWNGGHISIPSKYQGYNVEGIEKNALAGKQDILSVSFANGIKELYQGALNGCYNIAGSIVLPESLKKIGNGSLANLRGDITQLIIPNSLEFIDDYAFHNAYGIKSEIEFGDKLTSIGGRAFQGTRGMKGDLILPDSLTNLGEYAFDNSHFDGILKLSNNIEEIKIASFVGNSFKGDLIIPDSVKHLGKQCFNSGTFDGRLVLGKNIETTDTSIFNSSYNFIGDLIIPDKLQVITEGTFANLRGMAGKIVLPKNLKTVEKYAFHNSYSFTGDLMIPEGALEIGMYGFDGLKAINGNIYIPNSMTMPNYQIFANTGTTTAAVSVPKSWAQVAHGTGWRTGMNNYVQVIGRDSRQEQQQVEPKKDKVVNTKEIINEISNLKYFLFKKDN
ncbi:MAG: leucine-rich repeat protein, partial [Mycoplasma sp.]